MDTAGEEVWNSLDLWRGLVALDGENWLRRHAGRDGGMQNKQGQTASGRRASVLSRAWWRLALGQLHPSKPGIRQVPIDRAVYCTSRVASGRLLRIGRDRPFYHHAQVLLRPVHVRVHASSAAASSASSGRQCLARLHVAQRHPEATGWRLPCSSMPAKPQAPEHDLGGLARKSTCTCSPRHATSARPCACPTGQRLHPPAGRTGRQPSHLAAAHSTQPLHPGLARRPRRLQPAISPRTMHHALHPPRLPASGWPGVGRPRIARIASKPPATASRLVDAPRRPASFNRQAPARRPCLNSGPWQVRRAADRRDGHALRAAANQARQRAPPPLPLGPPSPWSSAMAATSSCSSEGRALFEAARHTP